MKETQIMVSKQMEKHTPAHVDGVIGLEDSCSNNLNSQITNNVQCQDNSVNSLARLFCGYR